MPLAGDIDWPGFVVAVTLIELTPGPNMAWLAALSLTEGRRAGLAACAGIALGLTLNAMLAALGIAALAAADPRIEGLLRWAGAALMLWMAWGAWREGSDGPARTAASPSQADHGARNFAAGLAVNVLNPKALVFFVAVVPPFLHARQPSFAEAAALAMVSVAIASTVHVTLVLGAARAHGWVASGERTRTVRRVMALALVGVAVWLVAKA